MRAVMGSWLLADPRRLELLGDFVETADSNLWRSWSEPRGNMSRYRVEQAFSSLLSEPVAAP